jgi:hypothetical protein
MLPALRDTFGLWFESHCDEKNDQVPVGHPHHPDVSFRRVFQMKIKVALLCLFVVIAIGMLLVALGEHYPQAAILVVDAAGKPIAGALIRPDGYRPKRGGGHYGWNTNLAPNTPVVTDSKGIAFVAYPRYAHERLEVGEISFSVDHPDYCHERPFRVVDASPPPRAPMREKVMFRLASLVGHAKSRADPVILQTGAVVIVSAHIGGNGVNGAQIFPQVSGAWGAISNLWRAGETNSLVTKRIRSGATQLRLAAMSGDQIYFSELIDFMAQAGGTNHFYFPLHAGAVVTGRLDDVVSRPVSNGVVIAEVFAPPQNPGGNALGWHTWADIRTDGTFALSNLPPGRLEVIAMCDGYVSENGTNQSSTMRTAQQWIIQREGRAVTVEMEPTATFVANILDKQQRPLAGAVVNSWPNAHWGQWSSTIFPGARFHTADALRGNLLNVRWSSFPARFLATSDASGIAIMHNIPPGRFGFAVEHERYTMPINTTNNDRHGSIEATSSGTITQTVTLQPKGRDELTN